MNYVVLLRNSPPNLDESEQNEKSIQNPRRKYSVLEAGKRVTYQLDPVEGTRTTAPPRACNQQRPADRSIFTPVSHNHQALARGDDFQRIGSAKHAHSDRGKSGASHYSNGIEVQK